MIFLLLLATNILLTFLIKTGNRYWLVSVPLTLLLIIGFIGWRIAKDNKIKQQEANYWNSAGTKNYGDHGEWIKLDEMIKEGRKLNATFIDLVVLQAFLTCIFQIIGRMKTTVRIYKWTSWTFTIFFIVMLLLRTMMSIVPATGFVS